MNENDKIKDLENQAKNTKQLMDRLNEAYCGMTTEELIRLALGGKQKEAQHDGNFDAREGN